MNTKLLRQKVLDLAIHGKLLDKAVVEALETTPGYEPASKLLERIRGESDVLFSDISKSETKLVSEATLPLASRVFERNSVVSDSERTAPSTGSNAARNARSNPISEDEIPFEIPENWCWCRLGDVCSFIGGGTPDKSKREYWNGSINWASVKDIKGNELFSTEDYITELGVECSSVHIAEIDDIILVTRISPGKAILSKIRTAINQDLKIVVPRITINKKYLLYYFLFSESDFIENSSGTTVKGIKLDYIIGKFLPLPPLEEQKLIVEEIERIFALIDTVEQNKTDLETVIKQTKSKILDLAIHGKLVPQDKADEPASKMLEKLRAEKEEKIAKGQLKRDKNDSYIYKSNDGKWKERKADGSEEEIEVPFEIPESWSWCKLKEIANIARGGSPRPIEDFITEDENGVNWIKIGDTKEGDKYITSVREKIKPEGIKHSRFVHAGDFLLTNSMSFGRPYILKVDGCIHDGWLVFADIGKIINSDFLYYSLSSDFIYTAFSFVAAGSTVKNLKSDTVKETFFPLPPLEEQKRIVSMIENTIKSLEIVNSYLKGN